MSALDFGFYYDDPDLPILVAPCLAVGEEWRFVIVDGNVVEGSGYLATGRSALVAVPLAAAWAFAGMVAQACDAPQSVYVMDVAQVEGELRVLELNPFSGADLYACDRAAIVRALARKF